jgi:hypothetical protein
MEYKKKITLIDNIGIISVIIILILFGVMINLFKGEVNFLDNKCQQCYNTTYSTFYETNEFSYITCENNKTITVYPNNTSECSGNFNKPNNFLVYVDFDNDYAELNTVMINNSRWGLFGIKQNEVSMKMNLSLFFMVLFAGLMSLMMIIKLIAIGFVGYQEAEKLNKLINKGETK